MVGVKKLFLMMSLVASFVLLPVAVNAEILNDNEFGSIEIKDLSVIENAAKKFTPVGLRFNVPRGGPVYAGSEIVIFYRCLHEKYVTLIDYSQDRIVKPLVMNEKIKITDGGLEREYRCVVGGKELGREWVLMIVSALPLSDARIQELALEPDKIELDDEILSVAVNDFIIYPAVKMPDRSIKVPVSEPVPIRSDMFIELTDFASYIDYPLNMYPYNPWPYMYLYPYARLIPQIYKDTYGPFINTWYVFPAGNNALESNFWNYAWDGWIDQGIWVIPSGGYWEGTLRIDDPYTRYFLRILPYLARKNNSFERLRVEINGKLVHPLNISGSIGWEQYTTTNPFRYYSLHGYLHQGENKIRLWAAPGEKENIELQMMDILPFEYVSKELEDSEQTGNPQEGGEVENISSNSDNSRDIKN